MDYKYQGIILNKKDVAETDRIYTIYTLESGKIRVLGKGVRRPMAKLAGHLEPLTFAEVFVARTRGLGKITGSIVSNNFPNIKADLDSLTAVFETFKTVEKNIVDQEEDQAIFSLLLEYLQSLEKISNQGEEFASKKDILTLGFLFKFLSELGYRTEMDGCVYCGTKLSPGNNYFSAVRGGALCGQCCVTDMRKIRMDDESIKFVRLFLKNRLENLVKVASSKTEINNLKKIAKEAFNWIANGEPAFDRGV